MRLFLLSLSMLCFISSPALANEFPDAVEQDVVIEVKGMVCDFCAQSLKKVFGKEDSVVGLSVDLDQQLVIVDTKDATTISDEKIKELIEWGGYDLVDIKRN